MSRTTAMAAVVTVVSIAAHGDARARHMLLASSDAYDDVPRIVPNDNRRPAGRLEGGVLTLRLQARDGVWHPRGYDRDGIRIGAFAEEGGPLQIPGPLVRVPVGTKVRTRLRNSLNRPLAVFGLGAERGFAGDSVLLKPDGVAEFAFVAETPGTYYYVGATEHVGFPGARLTGSLHGAIVVDPPGTTVAPGDRVFVISSWFTFDRDNYSNLSSDAVIAANGLAWPHSQVVEATQGDSLEWRWVNLTDLDHPMHLHGFHFRVDARGDGIRDTLYPPERRGLAVTEHVAPARTASTVWSPNRSGNWIFHCHMLSHMSAIEIVNTPLSRRGSARGHDARHMMGLLVVGIRVRPSGPRAEQPAEARRLRLLIRSRPGVYDENPGYAYVLGGSPEERRPARAPGSGTDAGVGERPAGGGQPRQPIARTGCRPLARHRARELPGRRARLERRGRPDPARHPRGRLAHRPVHPAEGGHLHVPLALQRDAADQLRAIRPDRGARAGQDVQPGDRPGARLQRRRPVDQLRSRLDSFRRPI